MSDDLVKRLTDMAQRGNALRQDWTREMEEAATEIARLQTEAGKVLAEQDAAYNAKTNAMIERHTDQIGRINREHSSAIAGIERQLDQVQRSRDYWEKRALEAEEKLTEADSLARLVAVHLDGFHSSSKVREALDVYQNGRKIEK